MAGERISSLSENNQREHYDRIAEEYNQHYSDEWSVRYRDRFLHRAMFDDLDLQGKKVLDAMCGYGDVTRYLLAAGADVTGLDVSPAQAESYSRRWGTAAVAASIFDSGLPDEVFDVVAVCGGLHHLHPHLDEGMREIARLLKPGGKLCFIEPHRHSMLEQPRRWWYRVDPLFEENEESIDVDALERAHAATFPVRRNSYGGSFAYLTVLNSMIFRVPLWLKPYYSPLMFWLESQLDRLNLRPLTLYVASCWTKG